MITEFSLITGCMLGIEFVDHNDFFEEGQGNHLVVDLLIIRMIFSWGFDE